MDRQQERVVGGAAEGPRHGAPEGRGAPTMMSPSPWLRTNAGEVEPTI